MSIKDFLQKWKLTKWLIKDEVHPDPIPAQEPQSLNKDFVYGQVITVTSISDVPTSNLQRKIYLVQRGGSNRWVVFDCPGGHNKRIEVNLMKSRYPVWTATINNDKITLNPSVAVEDVICNCHFWLKDNIAQKAYYLYEKSNYRNY